jgi:NAD(P)H dehydrogenase (quinone)
MIVVTGAGGQLGRAVIEQLLDRLSPEQVGASVRDPQKVQDLERRGVRVRHGDFTDPASLVTAFHGASRVLIVSADTTGEEAVRRHRTAIAAAASAGAERIVYTSRMGTDPTSPYAPMPDHAATETILHDSGVAFTALRNGFYASTVPQLMAGALQTGELRVPEDGPVAWTTHADLAAGAVLALTGDVFDGPTPPLTGPEALDMTDVAALASDLTGRTITRVVVPDAQYHAELLGQGLPEHAADMRVGLFVASRRGDFAPADPTLSRLLDRPTTTLAAFLDPTWRPTGDGVVGDPG